LLPRLKSLALTIPRY